MRNRHKTALANTVRHMRKTNARVQCKNVVKRIEDGSQQCEEQMNEISAIQGGGPDYGDG
jgi:hypothetical protein